MEYEILVLLGEWIIHTLTIFLVADAINHCNEFVKIRQWNKWKRSIFNQNLAVSLKVFENSGPIRATRTRISQYFFWVCWKWSKNIVKLLFFVALIGPNYCVCECVFALEWDLQRKKTEVKGYFYLFIIKLLYPKYHPRRLKKCGFKNRIRDMIDSLNW